MQASLLVTNIVVRLVTLDRDTKTSFPVNRSLKGKNTCHPLPHATPGFTPFGRTAAPCGCLAKLEG